jgi:hypothetical protein
MNKPTQMTPEDIALVKAAALAKLGKEFILDYMEHDPSAYRVRPLYASLTKFNEEYYWAVNFAAASSSGGEYHNHFEIIFDDTLPTHYRPEDTFVRLGGGS